MSPEAIERALKDLPQTGRLIKDRPYRQVWRVEAEGKAFYLKFYPRPGTGLKRMVRGNPALREFVRLQLLQKAGVPSPRAAGMLAGFRVGDTHGDAVLMEAIEPGVPLDQHLTDLELRGLREHRHLDLARQIREIVRKLAKAGLGHADLHLGNFLLSKGKLYLVDAYAVRTGGLKLTDLLLLGHSAQRWSTRGDILRAWRGVGPGTALPHRNSVSQRLWRKSQKRIWNDNAYFGRLTAGDWSGAFFKSTKAPYRWAPASQLRIEAKDWERQWPRLLGQIESDQLEAIKDSRSGQVLKGQVVLDGRPVDVIVKRPRRKYWHRYVNEIGRGSRAARAWARGWSLLFRGVPTAWPMLLMERRVLGYVVDQVIVCEQVPGDSLAWTDLAPLSRDERDTLFLRAGRILRRLESLGLYHWDAKATNFMVRPDPVTGPAPVLVDVDGIRRIQWTRSAIHRLLKSLRDMQQGYNPADSLALCHGYAPFARIERDAPEESLPDEAPPTTND